MLSPNRAFDQLPRCGAVLITSRGIMPDLRLTRPMGHLPSAPLAIEAAASGARAAP